MIDTDIFDNVSKKLGGTTPSPYEIRVKDIITKMDEKSDASKNIFQRTMDYLSGAVELDAEAVRKEKQVIDILDATKNNETTTTVKNPYSFRKFSGDEAMGEDLGAYQVTTAELKSWSKNFTGKQIDPEEFMKNPTLQDSYMRAKVETLLNEGVSLQEIFALHRGGLTNYADPKVRARRVKTRQKYVNDAMSYMETLKEESPS